jgi:hypothetical protein
MKSKSQLESLIKESLQKKNEVNIYKGEYFESFCILEETLKIIDPTTNKSLKKKIQNEICELCNIIGKSITSHGLLEKRQPASMPGVPQKGREGGSKQLLQGPDPQQLGLFLQVHGQTEERPQLPEPGPQDRDKPEEL